MKKQYLTDLIGDSYKTWNKKKIIIAAPTGMGKSTFIINKFLPYLKEYGKKLLILCNRKLLREQYWQALVQEYDSYNDLKKSVDLMTYQQLSKEVNNSTSIDGLFYSYDMIVCDEAHYFYADSDFNGSGTFVLLQAIVCAGMAKTIIFMSATMENVQPFIEQTIRNGYNTMSRHGNNQTIDESCREIRFYDFMRYKDYSRFHCVYIPDMESLYAIIAESSQKSVLFIDNKEMGAEVKEALIKTGKVEAKNIAVLNAENMDDGENNEVVRKLTMANRLACKILITTSVLDNGVSIHDPEVGNLMIMTESKIGFLQMLGRVRAETVDSCNLFFVRRNEAVFKKRMIKYHLEIERFEKLKENDLKMNFYSYLHAVWDENDAEIASFYKRALVLAYRQYQIYSPPKENVELVREGVNLYVNEFAKCKIGDMYVVETRFYGLAAKNPIRVIHEQMKCMGKEADELEIRESTHFKEKEGQLKDELLKVNGFGKEELQIVKEKIVKEFRKDFFPDINAKNGTIAYDKLNEVCRRFGLCLSSDTDEHRRKVYYITEQGAERGGENHGGR